MSDTGETRDIVEAQIRRELDGLRRRIAEQDEWVEAWTQLTGDIADLIHKVRKRKKGRRWATVIDLHNLLSQQVAVRPEQEAK